ncbi:LysR family transcriptional regulator [Aeromicrobium sp. UC242_57]|uniref:LysR family transcriptional regulator n=1 Tax=Aeromicrobium sp. UC242_57 TaxID=3374624 RepID=UPI003794F805
MNDPDLAQLRALAAVVDEGSFDAAAAALHLTPSAVSQRIKALEQSAGRILVRRTKPVAPTEAGQAFLRLARQLDVLVHEASVAAASTDQRSVTIPIAVNADSLATWLLPALASLPSSICLDLVRDDQARTAELLRSGAVMAADHLGRGSGPRLPIHRARHHAVPADGLAGLHRTMVLPRG